MNSASLTAKQAERFGRARADGLHLLVSHTEAAGQGQGQRVNELTRTVSGSS